MPRRPSTPDEPDPRRRHESEDEGEVVYLPGASENEPSKPWLSGWPQQLVEATYGLQYWRLRDGAGAMGTGEESTDVIYGRILRWQGDKPVVEGHHQYLPTGKTLSDLVMQAGAWYAADDLEDTFIRDLNY